MCETGAPINLRTLLASGARASTRMTICCTMRAKADAKLVQSLLGAAAAHTSRSFPQVGTTRGRTARAPCRDILVSIMSSDIPTTMRAAQIDKHHDELKIRQLPVPQPGPGEVHAVDGDWAAPSKLPLIPGHEGAGVVAAVGPQVGNVKVGDRVGIAWLHSTCGYCEYCNTGRETQCPKQENSGYTVDGCFAEYAIGNANFLAKIPENLSFDQAAPILCAGVTTYAGVRHTEVRQGQFITVIGAAGGLGHLAVRYAVAMGLRVIGIDVGQEKLDLVTKLGAEHAVDGSDPDAVKKIQEYTKGGAHGVLCLAASLGALKSAVKMVRRAGTVVLIGLPKGDLGVDVVDLVLRGITVKGSLVGTRQEMNEALDFAGRGLVHAEVEVRTLSEINDVFARLRSGDIKGRVVLDINK